MITSFLNHPSHHQYKIWDTVKKEAFVLFLHVQIKWTSEVSQNHKLTDEAEGNFYSSSTGSLGRFLICKRCMPTIKKRVGVNAKNHKCVWAEMGWKAEKTDVRCLTGFPWQPIRDSDALKHCKLLDPQKPPISVEFLLAVISSSEGKFEKRLYNYVKWQGERRIQFSNNFSLQSAVLSPLFSQLTQSALFLKTRDFKNYLIWCIFLN